MRRLSPRAFTRGGKVVREERAVVVDIDTPGK